MGQRVLGRSAAVAAGLLLLSGCAASRHTGTRADSKIGEDPVSHVELVISSITKPEAEAFKQQIEAQGDIHNVVLKSFRDDLAVFELDVRGCECDLPSKMVKIPTPGFKYEGRVTRVRFSAFDNRAPKVSFVFPSEPGRVLTDPEQLVTVEVPDDDVAEVRVNEVAAAHVRGSVYRAKVKLKDGENVLHAVARDKAGNEGVADLTVQLVPAGPVMAVVKVLVEGKVDPGSSVLIGGRDVPVDTQGRYKAEIPVRKGQTEVEIISIDRYGNKTVTMRGIGE